VHWLSGKYKTENWVMSRKTCKEKVRVEEDKWGTEAKGWTLIDREGALDDTDYHRELWEGN
jgi:hypothetical protein